MFPLLQLPDDILRVVIENFEYERRFLCQLARVCRRFSELTRPFIFRHIENPPGLTRRIRLQELLEENPNLKAYVHSIDTLTIGNSGVLRSRANEYKGYPNLRVLKVEKGTRPKLAHEDWRDRRKARTGENEFQCQFLEKYEFGNVREVYLQRPRNKMAADFTGTELLRFILLPNVRHLEAKSLMEIREPQLPPSLQEVKSRLTSLVLAGSQYWSMTPTALRTILTHCPELRILRIPYPLVHSTAEKPETISPSLLRWALEPVKDTLRELAILHAYGKVKYDDSYLDLSMFSVLKSINMISYCVIHPLEIGNDKNDIYKLLPPKLKELHVRILVARPHYLSLLIYILDCFPQAEVSRHILLHHGKPHICKTHLYRWRQYPKIPL